MKPVTDPGLLAQLDGGSPRPVTDQALLAQLESEPDVAADTAKSTASGLAKGAIGVATLPRSMMDLGYGAGKWVSRQLGLAPQKTLSGLITDQPAQTPIYDTLAPIAGPTTAQAQSGVERVTGPFHKPETTLGKYAQTAGEFAPGAMFPASKIGRVANVMVPAVTSETAGQLAEGTAAEPYVRAGGALAGAMGAGRVARFASPAVKIPTPQERIAETFKAADEGYKSPAISAVEFRPSVVDALAGTTLKQLDRAKFNERIAPSTRAILDDMKTPINGAAHTIEDLQTAKDQLGRLAGNFNNPIEQAAASRAIANITKYIEQMPQGHLARGSAKDASGAWNAARENYAAAKTAERVQEKLTSAEQSAAAAHSGANVGNRQRQKLNQLLSTKKSKRGLTDEEGDLILEAVQGSTLGNALRTGGNLLGGGGGLGGLVSAIAGGTAAGPLGLTLPVVGRGLKVAGDRITRKQASKIVDAILSRAPATQNAKTQAVPGLSRRQRNAIAAQLSAFAVTPQIKQLTEQPR